jgi:hypothetical protein
VGDRRVSTHAGRHSAGRRSARGPRFAAALALLAHEFQGAERGFALGVWGAITGAALAIYLVVGGLIVDGPGWRWVFLVNLPDRDAPVQPARRRPGPDARARRPDRVLGPFAEGQHNIFSDPVLSEIGAAHDKTVAQVVQRWLIQRDVIVIPKSVRPERMRENIDVFDFELTDDEMTRIAAMDTGTTLFFDHADPEWVSRLNSVRID